MIDLTEIHGASILIVDDLPANVLLLETMLRGAGYRNLSSTMDPLAVTELHRTQQFDLILLDLNMPRMDGFEVMEALRANEPDDYLPVLVITAQPAHKLRALRAGARDFVSKPFELVEMQTRIRNMLEVRMLHRRINEHNQNLERTVQLRTAALSASEARFRSFARLSADWFWEQDRDGRFIEISGPVLEVLDVTVDPLTGVVVPASPGNGVWQAHERAVLLSNIADRRPFLDHLCSRTRADGSSQYLQVSGEPIFDAGGRYAGFRGVGSDVTDRVLRDGARLAGSTCEKTLPV
jgi:PAS domain S-box-containing protein